MAKPKAVPRREIKRSIVYIAVVVGIVVLSTPLLVTPYWLIWPIIIGILLLGVGYFSASKSFYRCPSCNKSFRISPLQDFFAPHGITRGENGEIYEWKLLRCPDCRKREKCYRTENA